MKEKEMGAMHVYENSHSRLIEGCLNIGEQQAVPLIKQVKEAGEPYAPEHAYILYDAPPGTSCPMIEAVKDADYILLVSEATAFGLNDMQITVDTLRELNKPFGVVVNKAKAEQNLITDFCETASVPIVASLPYSDKFAKAYAKGALVEGIDAPLTEALETVYQYLTTKMGVS